MTLKVDIQKSVQVLLYILKKLGGKADFHKIFKIIYYAEQKHLTRFGFPILGDTFVAMSNGPVPSTIYDILKSLRGEGLWQPFSAQFETFFELKSRYEVEAKLECEKEFIAETEIECLDQSIEENRSFDFRALTKKSHGSAWKAAYQDGEMSMIEIALEGGADEEIIKFLKLNIENATFQVQ